MSSAWTGLLYHNACSWPPAYNTDQWCVYTHRYNLTQSSRALGWDTNSYTMNTYRGCGNFSTLTYTHLGYTGKAPPPGKAGLVTTWQQQPGGLMKQFWLARAMRFANQQALRCATTPLAR